MEYARVKESLHGAMEIITKEIGREIADLEKVKDHLD